MNGCFITDFVVFSQTKQTMESLEIAAFDAIILIKTRHLHFPLGLRKSTKKDKIKTEHAVTLRKKYSEANSSYNHAVIRIAFQHLKWELFSLKTQLLHYLANFLLLQFTGDWNTNLDIGLLAFFIRFKIKTLTLEFKTDPRKLSKT